MSRGWIAFGVLGVLASVLAWLPIVQAIAGGYFLAYPPFAHLSLGLGVLALVPCLALARRFRERLTVRARSWSALVLACATISFVVCVTTLPGAVFADPRLALLVLAIVVGAQHAVLRDLRTTWLALSLAGIAPALANTAFSLVVD